MCCEGTLYFRKYKINMHLHSQLVLLRKYSRLPYHTKINICDKRHTVLSVYKQLNIKAELFNIYTWHYTFWTTPSLTIPVRVCSHSFWLPLPVPFGPSTCWRWGILVVLTWAYVHILLVVLPAVRGCRKVLPRRVHRSAVHFTLQVSYVIPDVCHQQKEEIKGAWRALGGGGVEIVNYLNIFMEL